MVPGSSSPTVRHDRDIAWSGIVDSVLFAMEMTPVPVSPYWDNATIWYMTINPPPWHQAVVYDEYVLEFEQWLTDQGVTLGRQLTIPGPTAYHPWLYFADPVMATAFVLRWS
jgi:hypothetical protein